MLDERPLHFEWKELAGIGGFVIFGFFGRSQPGCF